MRCIETKPDGAIAKAGIDLIECLRDLLAPRQFGRGKGKEQISLPRGQKIDIAQMDAKADDRTGPNAAPEAYPEGAVQPEKDRRVLGRKAADISRPSAASQKADREAEPGRNATIAAQTGARLLDQPAADMIGADRIAKLRGQHLAVAEPSALGGNERDLHTLQHPHEAFALDRSPDQPGVARIERMETWNIENACAVEPGFHSF